MSTCQDMANVAFLLATVGLNSGMVGVPSSRAWRKTFYKSLEKLKVSFYITISSGNHNITLQSHPRTPLSSHWNLVTVLPVPYLNPKSEALGVIEGVERDVRNVLIVGRVITVEGELSLGIHCKPFDDIIDPFDSD